MLPVGEGESKEPGRDGAQAGTLPSHPPHLSRRDVIVAVSLANWLGLPIYANVLDPSHAYFLDLPVTAAAYLGSLAVVGVMAALGVVLAVAYRRSKGWGARALELLFFVGVALALHGTRPQLDDLFAEDSGKRIVGIAVEATRNLALAAVLLPVSRRRTVRRAVSTFLLVLSPAAVLYSGHVLVRTMGALSGADARLFVERPRAALQPTRSGPRVVILLMDELDQFLAFDDRTPDLHLPVLDGLAGTSFHGTRARAPAMTTDEAIPALLTGHTVLRVREAGPSDQWLFFDDGSTALFSDADTVLRAATASGRNVSLVGWYHPYCRVLGDDVANCVSGSYLEPEILGFAGAFLQQSSLLVASWPYGRSILQELGAPKLTVMRRRYHGESWKRVQKQAREVVGDPRFDLVFVHYPLPHPPGIWDPEKRQILVDEPGTYDGNLALADESLGTLLDAIEAGPRGAETYLVLLSDHGKRITGLDRWLPSARLPDGGSRPIPFLVRVPGGAAVSFDTPFDAVVLHELVPELLEGRLTTSDAVRDWIAARAWQTPPIRGVIP